MIRMRRAGLERKLARLEERYEDVKDSSRQFAHVLKIVAIAGGAILGFVWLLPKMFRPLRH